MPTILEAAYRHDVLRLMPAQEGNVGVELGVAQGGFSECMVKSGRFKMFFGVDRYYNDRGHDVEQYKSALRRVGFNAPYRLLRMTFDEAYDLFEDDSLDFIYVDGYAHTGEEGGSTIYRWAHKVKPGGVIAGDDYHPRWPLVIRAVDRFAADTGFELFLTSIMQSNTAFSSYPTWAFVKTGRTPICAPPELALACAS